MGRLRICVAVLVAVAVCLTGLACAPSTEKWEASKSGKPAFYYFGTPT